MAVISLNTTILHLREFVRNGQMAHVHRDMRDPRAPVIAGQSDPIPASRTAANILRWPNWTEGFGRSRIDSDSAFEPKEYRHVFDTDGVDTRRHFGAYLPIKKIQSFHDGLEVVRASVEHKGVHWAAWQDDTSTDTLLHKMITTGAATWVKASQDVDTAGTQVALDMSVFGTNIVVLTADVQGIFTNHSSDPDSSAFTQVEIGSSLLDDNVGANEDIDAGLLSAIGGRIVIVAWAESTGLINVYSSPTVGGTEVLEITIASGGGPKGVGVIPGPNGIDRLMIGTSEGLYSIDASADTGSWVLESQRVLMSFHPDNCRRMVVHNGFLWFPQGVSDDEVPIMWRAQFIQNGNFDVNEVPNDLSKGDGVPSDALGPWRRLVSRGRYLYASQGGGKASRNARVWCHTGSGWHTVVKHSTANQKIEWINVTSDDDSVERLHYAVRTSSTVSDTLFIQNPSANPNSGLSIFREASGFIDLPYVNGGDPLDSATWLRVGVNADDLGTTSAEHINVDTGIKSGGTLQARNNSNLGDITSTVSRLGLGSGAGVASTDFGSRINLLRDGGTDVAVDAETDEAFADASSNTMSHTVGSGSNQALVVFAAAEDGSTFSATGVTYNGIAMTQHGSEVVVASSLGSLAISAWVLVAPATGANDVVVTYDGEVSDGHTWAISLNNVDQANPLATSVTSSQNPVTATGNITPASLPEDLVVGYFALDGSVHAETITAEQETLHVDTALASEARAFGLTMPAGPRTTTQWSATWTNTDGLALISFAAQSVGDQTQSPVLKDVEYDYLKLPAEIEKFTFLVDLEETAGRAAGETPNTIMTAIRAARDLGTLPVLVDGATSVNVKVVVPFEFYETITAEGELVDTPSDTLAQHTGLVLVTCLQPI